MNKKIDKKVISKIYDEIEKNPINLTFDYNENLYKRLKILVMENKENKSSSENNKLYAKDILNLMNKNNQNDEETEISEMKRNQSILESDFNLTNNINNFTENDINLLRNGEYFNKYPSTKGSSPHVRFFIFDEDLNKLQWGINKEKLTKSILSKDILDVYVGSSSYSEVFKKLNICTNKIY